MGRPPGLLRLLVLLHESEELGAGNSILRCLEPLEGYGWTASTWLPGAGPLENVVDRLGVVSAGSKRPFAFSVRGWREAPGALARLAGTPRYVADLRAALLRLRPHVVHANTLLSLPEAAVARSCGLPLVVQVHEEPAPSAKRGAAVRAAAGLADVLVGVSGPASAMLRAHAGRTPVLNVPNGVATVRVQRTRSRHVTVGTVATVSRIKGTDVFFRAAQLAARARPGLRFEHVGAPDLHRDPGLDEELDALGRSDELRDALARRGSLPASDALPRFDVFVLASRSEAFPLATLEAMASGIPVIASAVGGIPEQISHLESGILVPPDDPAALADWIVRLADDPELRQRLGAAASARAQTHFSLERQAAGLHRAYLSALVRRYGPPAAQAAALA